MKFLKKIFDDDAAKIGLCGFKSLKPQYNTTVIEKDFFFNPFESQKVFETNFSKNILLL